MANWASMQSTLYYACLLATQRQWGGLDIVYKNHLFSASVCNMCNKDQTRGHLKADAVVFSHKNKVLKPKQHKSTKELLDKIESKLPFNKLMKEYPKELVWLICPIGWTS